MLTVDSVSVSHDPCGNVTLIPSTLRTSACGLEWDFDNRLSSADTDNDSTADVQFGYDALGRRVQKGAAVYAFDGWQVVAEYESGNSPSIPDEQYVYASYVDEPILKEGTVPGGTGIVYYHRNQQYSIVALTDDQGEVVERYSYDPHGNLSIFDEAGSPISATACANPYTWTGREFDAETGLYYFRARYFDPAMGRFLSRDPLGYVDGMGLYAAYFGIGNVDPSGLLREWHSPWLGGVMQVSIFYGPWRCRRPWLEYCEAKCRQRDTVSRGCVWVADIRTQVKVGWNTRLAYEAVTYCCCEYTKCSREIRTESRTTWERTRPTFWRELETNWEVADSMTVNGIRWPVHHVDPIQFGGHPTALENLIPLPPEVHSDVHYAYRVCEGRTAGYVDYSEPGPYWPHEGGWVGARGTDHGLPAHIPGAPGTGWK